jgi:zinc protease
VKKLFVLFLILGLAACDSNVDVVVQTDTPAAVEAVVEPALPEGITHIETVAAGDGEISIPYSKYRLANGLTVVLHEDHSDPLVHVDVTYHVGSNREQAGRSGFAHFFEHMMFQGSKNVADEEHFKIVSNAGGTLNGTTNSDRTNYFETLPVNQLETALWLEADRMGLLLEAVTQEKFEVQRETVKNERGQRVDNQPYGRAGETIQKNLYPAEHPYSWPVIGWLEDLDRANVDDLKRFFLRWYGPNNAALTIGGDIDPMQTLELVNKYFGPILAGPEVEDLPKQPGKLDADRYVTLEDNIHLPAIALLVPTVYATHEDEAALDAAAKILGQGQASLLYQRLVQSGRAVQAFVQHGCRELACELYFIVIQNPGSGETLAEMETAIRETMLEFADRPVSEDDLQRFKAGYESNRIFGLQSVSGKVSSLAAFETFTNNPNGIADELNRYLGVTAEDVNRVFKKYVADQPAVILSIVPNGQTQLAAKEPNYVTPERNIPESFGDEDSQLALRPVVDNFDRSQDPVPGTNPGVDLPPIWDTRLANGVRLLAVPNDETPTVTIRASFEMGQRDEPPGKAGLTALTVALMGEATTEHTAAEYAEELERIGAGININSGDYQTTISVNTLSKHLDKAVALMMERMLKPAFTQEDFDRVKSQTMEALMQARKTPENLASRAVGAVLLGTDHPMSYPRSGLPETVEAITLDDVKAYYAAHIPTHISGVLVSAGLQQEEILKAVQGIAELKPEEVYREEVAGMNEITGRTIYLVDKEGAAQSSVRVRQPSIKYDALGEYYRAGLMNFNLGGTFNLHLRRTQWLQRRC